MAFDGNAYRKGVLAPIEARGGLPASDPFEWYDLPLDAKLKDSAVRTQVDAVWAFWQKQREAPKYRGLILALLARHEQVAPLLWSQDSRRALADDVRRERAERSADRFSELDAAIGRLVERFGGIPAAKVAGLLVFAAERSIGDADARARIGAHPVVADTARAGAVDPYRRARADLEELGRLLEGPPCPSLFVLLDLPPTASRREVMTARDRVAARNRELLPDRRRALVDDLLAAVTQLLVDGDPETYLSALAVDVVDTLRPRFSAAVLVEDLLTADDAAFLIAEAEAQGLDAGRARDVVVQLAREAGIAMPATARRADPPPRAGGSADGAGSSVPEGYRRPPRAPKAEPPASGWHEQLTAARAALRGGRPREAQRLVESARGLAGGSTPPIRAVSDEVESVLAEAASLWKAVEHGLAQRRLAAVLESLQRLQAIAADVPSSTGRLPADLLAEAAPAAEEVALALARVQGLPAADQEEALLALADEHPGSPDVQAALAALGLQPPWGLRAAVAGGGVHLTWSPSPARGRVDYRVVAVEPDGRRRVLGTTSACDLETAAPPGGQPLPAYAVQARRLGVTSAEARADAPAPPGPATVDVERGAVDLPPVSGLSRVGDRLRWEWPAGCTEVVLAWREGAPPDGPDGPGTQRRKVTNTRYEIDGGAVPPEGAGLHVAVFACARRDGRLVTSGEAPPSARTSW